MTFYRVQSADRDVTELLDSGYQFSHAWSGSHDREGVSVCETIDDLALYLASHVGCGIPVRDGEWVIVEVEADEIPGACPVDPEFERLVRPTAIVAVYPVDEEFLALIDEMDAVLDGFTDPNLED